MLVGARYIGFLYQPRRVAPSEAESESAMATFLRKSFSANQHRAGLVVSMPKCTYVYHIYIYYIYYIYMDIYYEYII